MRKFFLFVLTKCVCVLSAIVLYAVNAYASDIAFYSVSEHYSKEGSWGSLFIIDSPSFLSDTLVGDRLDSILVSVSRAGANTPVAATTLSKQALESAPSTYSLPMLLNFIPSVVATTEGGLGLGYSNLRVRGSDASRTNVTLNGVAINDGESQEVIWANIPALPNFLQSVQLQRGVGTSVNGPGAFGATLDMQTKTAAPKPYGIADISFGSYRTFMESIAAGTGSLGGKNGNWYNVDFAYNHANTRGYIRNAKAKLNSLLFSASWRNECNSLKFIYVLGSQHTGITWEGCPIDIYHTNRKYNVAGEYYDDHGNLHYYDNETDNYRQHHLQLHYIRQFSNALSLNSTVHFTKGDGYYENYKYNVKFSKYGLENQVIDGVTYKKTDVIIRQNMDNSYIAGMLNIKYKGAGVDIVSGANYSFYDGDHFGRVLWSKYNQNIDYSQRWYANNGKKADLSFFAKAEVEMTEKLTAFLDLQYRFVNFRLGGLDKDFVSLDNKRNCNFFNPKAGMSFAISANDRLFFSVSMAHREPSRSDIKESIKAKKQSQLQNEKMVDFELGYQMKRETFGGEINLYSMNYKNQLVSTGRLTETGYVIQENIPNSYRRGIEVFAYYKPIEAITLFAASTFSKNKLKNYTLFVDAYDNSEDWNPVEQQQIFLKKSNLTLSPEFIFSGGLTVNPCKNTSITLSAKHVGKQYMDNSSMEIAKVPAYSTVNLDANKTILIRNKYRVRISFCVDNLLNNKYYSYGWLYRAVFRNGDADYVEKGVYVQAGIHFTGKLQFSF